MNKKTVIKDLDKDMIKKSSRINTWNIVKEQISHECIKNEVTIKGMKVNIGDIFDCLIGENIGEEQSNSRPVLVVSKTYYNDKSAKVTVVPLSKNVRTRVVNKTGKPKTELRVQTHFRLKKSDYSFLDADSVVKCEQIKTVSKARLTTKLGSIDISTLNSVKKRIKMLLDL